VNKIENPNRIQINSGKNISGRNNGDSSRAKLKISKKSRRACYLEKYYDTL